VVWRRIATALRSASLQIRRFRAAADAGLQRGTGVAVAMLDAGAPPIPEQAAPDERVPVAAAISNRSPSSIRRPACW